MRELRASLFTVFLILLAIGVVAIYSASAIYGYDQMGDSLYFLKRHLFYLIIGFILMLASMFVELDLLRRWSKPLVISAIALLVLVLVPGVGRVTGGARRWFRFGQLNFQPSEAAKVVFIVYLSAFIARREKSMSKFFRGYLPPLIVLGAISGLILLEPDLGSAVLVAAIAFLMLFVSGVRMAHMLTTCLAALPVFYFLVLSSPYRRNRFKAFVNPWADMKGSGFQLIQSLVALGSGGLFGVGLGQSRQKLFYLPAAHTDFIFSIIGEELGLLGTASVMTLFILFLWQGMRIAFRTEETFSKLVAFGIVTMVALEVMINIGVVCGILPTKGLPLPFISYGGTSLIFHMAAVGLLLNVAKGSELEEKRRSV